MFRVLVFTVTQTHTKRPHEIKTYSFTDVFERWEFDEDGGFNDPSKSSNNKKKSKTRGKVQKTAVHAVVKKKKCLEHAFFPSRRIVFRMPSQHVAYSKCKRQYTRDFEFARFKFNYATEKTTSPGRNGLRRRNKLLKRAAAVNRAASRTVNYCLIKHRGEGELY